MEAICWMADGGLSAINRDELRHFTIMFQRRARQEVGTEQSIQRFAFFRVRPWPRFAVRWWRMRSADPQLLAFLRASDDAAADTELGRLLGEVADPIIRGILARKFRVSLGPRQSRGRDENTLDAEDTCSEAHGLLARRLQSYRQALSDNAPAAIASPIADFRAYVAGLTYSAWVDYLRRRKPERARLLNQLRYLLEDNRRQSGFALWADTEGERWCGFAAWNSDGTAPADAGRVRELLADPAEFVSDALPYREAREGSPARLLAVIFDRLGGPARLEDVLDAAARLWDAPDEVAEPNAATAPENFACSLPGPHEQARWAEYLRWLWDAVGGLNARQRAAFLLNSEVIKEFEHTGVASIRVVAGALDVSPEEFAAFWDELPLSDAAIAARLGVNRQQVINLRKAARIILGRKLTVLLADPPVSGALAK